MTKIFFILALALSLNTWAVNSNQLKETAEYVNGRQNFESIDDLYLPGYLQSLKAEYPTFYLTESSENFLSLHIGDKTYDIDLNQKNISVEHVKIKNNNSEIWAVNLDNVERISNDSIQGDATILFKIFISHFDLALDITHKVKLRFSRSPDRKELSVVAHGPLQLISANITGVGSVLGLMDYFIKASEISSQEEYSFRPIYYTKLPEVN